MAESTAESEEDMAESEAIEKLRAYHKCQRLQVKGIYEDCNNKRCDDCDLCYMQGTTGEHMTAIGIAIQALEKQIPKKPIEKEMPYSEDVGFNSEWHCPCCNSYIGYFTEGMSEPEQMEYCNNCGQHIAKDWSDEE